MNRRTVVKRMGWGVLAILILSLAGLPSLAQGDSNRPDQVVSSVSCQQGPTDPVELEAFLNEFFARRMEELHIPGAVFVLVKDGEIFFAKGYGFADLEKQAPVIPDKTLFRVASLSKLFTATAVMQLYDRGLIDLDDDVNEYLRRFQLEDNYPEPVTFANLLTHTGGFDERYIGISARSESELVPLGQHLADRMPPRVFPPGEYSYSNYGITLAGYLVEEISGVPFAQYIEENILQPLGMYRSSFQQPLPPHLASDLAVGYDYRHGSYRPLPFEYANIAPAVALSVTATDMARFMIAHLQDGRYGNVRILSEATAQEMHRQQFTNHPRLPGMTYGFIELFENDRRAIWHSGTALGYSSLLFLLPDQNLGFFVAYNRREPKLRAELVSQFLDHYYPIQEKPISPQPPADFQSRAGRFAGFYRDIEYPRCTLDKLAVLVAGREPYRVTATGDGTLTLHHYPEGDTSRWVEVEPLLFQRVDGEGYMAFRQDENGRITHLFYLAGTEWAGLGKFERLRWYETFSFQLSLLGFSALVFLSACVVWPVGGLIRRLRKRPSQAARLARPARLLAGLISALNLVFLIGLALALASDPLGIRYGVPPIVIVLLCIPLLTTALTIGLPILTALVWKNRCGSVAWRLYYSLVTVAALAFIWFLNYWNLLGFRF